VQGGSPRDLPAPQSWRLTDADGATVTYDVTKPVLVVAVKANCDGCRPFYRDELTGLENVDVVVVTREFAEEFRDAVRPVYVAPELLDALVVRWPPLCVMVAADPARVVAEVVPFGVKHVVEELERLGAL
jgi:hypothetical protein